jgi:hypothetical protein
MLTNLSSGLDYSQIMIVMTNVKVMPQFGASLLSYLEALFTLLEVSFVMLIVQASLMIIIYYCNVLIVQATRLFMSNSGQYYKNMTIVNDTTILCVTPESSIMLLEFSISIQFCSRPFALGASLASGKKIRPYNNKGAPSKLYQCA